MRPVDVYTAEFERFAADVGGPAWLSLLRRDAIRRFEARGLPTTREEEWRFTSVQAIAETRFVRARDGIERAAEGLDRGDIVCASLEDGAPRLVFVNGRFAPELSRTPVSGSGARPSSGDGLVRDLRSVMADDPARLEPLLARAAAYLDQPFAALNTAFFEDGAVVWIPDGAAVEEPIHLVFLSIPDAGHRLATSHREPPPTVHDSIVLYPRVLIRAGANSQARIVETYAGPGGRRYLTNAVTDVVVGPNAMVDHYKVQQEGLDGFHVARIQAWVGRAAVFTSHSISLGGSLARHDVVAVMEDEGGECTLNGLYLVDGARLVDHHTTIDHARPHCASHELYKGILAGQSRAVFNGKIIVRPDAQKTDAKQTNKALLLSDDARINSTPQLEIFANDVRCTHGAAVGQLDDDALFYLRARGIAEAEARRLLIHAFAADVLDRVRIEPLRLQLEKELTRRLS